MTLAEAQHILQQSRMYSYYLERLQSRPGAYIHYGEKPRRLPLNREMILDGRFTADELEALAVWMRANP